ncbi:MAG: DUF3108 domain-containing protein [Proteobacteria bacterium]|nr:DUF3108 domain-containing protein [Pseudomonadota bacterium]MBU4297727.1 DUF3108 domain-containing protein [Pseudomonadota bacterium]MCG2749604.1 DUF3108 domain-containing protein [Desulfobulbaceae bacterium]
MRNFIRRLAIVALAALLAAGQSLVAAPGAAAGGDKAASPAEATPDADLLRSAYGGGESLLYSVTWFGVKAGELLMQVVRQEGAGDGFLIEVTVKSAGLLAVLYPVEDHFITTVSGSSRLPLRHEMVQKEGPRKNNKVTIYDQEHGRITYTKNDDVPKVFTVDGPVHNEFSAFLFMRVMPFAMGEQTVVPTFADKKRHLVAVSLEAREPLKTILGRRGTLEVKPRLTFKGLYQKAGDPLIWLTDDPARIPVKIKAKIVIGSLTANLIAYQGPSGCFKATER